jgi:hypothetical protein
MVGRNCSPWLALCAGWRSTAACRRRNRYAGSGTRAGTTTARGASSDSRTDPLNFSTSELELLELGLEIPFQPSRCNPHTLIVRCLEHGHAYTVLFQLR